MCRGVVRYQYRTPKGARSQKCRAGKLKGRLWAGVEGLVRVLTPRVRVPLSGCSALCPGGHCLLLRRSRNLKAACVRERTWSLP